MRNSLIVAVLAFSAAAVSPALAADIQSLGKDGFAPLGATFVTGDFNGCDRGLQIPLDNGKTFVCNGFSYSYARHPPVVVLRHIKSGAVRILVNGVAFDGALTKAW